MEDVKTYYRRHLPHYQPEYATFHAVFRLAGSLPAHVVAELKQEQEQLKRKVNQEKNVHIDRMQSVQFHKLYFERFDALLDHASNGPTWLKEPEVAMIVKEAIDYRNDNVFNVMAYCIMPNHVHMLFEPLLNDVSRLVRLQSRPRSIEMERAESTNVKKGRDNISPYNCDVSRFAESINKKDGRDSVSTYMVTKIMESLKKYTALRANRILQRSGSFWQHESYDHVIRDENELENTLWYILFNPVKAGLVDDWTNWKWSYCKPELLM